MKPLDRDQSLRIAQKYGSNIGDLAAELEQALGAAIAAQTAARTAAGPSGGPARARVATIIRELPEGSVANERIIATAIGARPVARVRDNEATTEFLGPAAPTWNQVIERAKRLLDAAIPAVGRIELNNGDAPWVGTGWLIAPDIVVTNRHVAEAFAKREPESTRFVFRTGLLPGLVSADIDFLEEENRLDAAEHPIIAVLWIAPPRDADVAFLRISRAKNGPPLPAHVELGDDVAPDTVIAAIGYPARDPTIRDQALVVRIFGDDVYEKKRLAPGRVMGIDGFELRHDCSTLGGNSGSVLIDLSTGKAVGLHCGGLMDDSANIAVTASHLRRLLAEASTAARENRIPDVQSAPAAVVPQPRIYTTTLHIPIEITVKIGTPAAIPGSVPHTTIVAATPTTPADPLEAAVRAATHDFANDPSVLQIRTGYRFKNGWITDERVVVFEVRDKLTLRELKANAVAPFPREILGVGVDVRTASLPAQLEAEGVDLLTLERPGKHAGYREPPGYDDPDSDVFLGEIDETVDAVFHVSPDTAWKNLEAFLGRVERRLFATMYEWDAANHISAAIEKAITKQNSLLMVTQDFGVAGREGTSKAVEDMLERLGDRFEHTWASVVGRQKLFPNSYHIKVASRDGEEVWLSSGNWKESNQPDDLGRDPLRSFNREWNAVVKNARLARLFEKYIRYDFAQAKRFPPVRGEAAGIPDVWFFIRENAELAAEARRRLVPAYESELVIANERVSIQPLLTPDRNTQGEPMFMRAATEMLERATTSIYIQNQSFKLTDENNEELDAFFAVLKDKQRSIDDVRIIMRDARDYNRPADLVKQQELLERLQDFGLDVSRDALRLQSKCHTKGIIVDSSQVILGSQNITNEGSLFNRDASLLVRSAKVAQFYEKIFLFDWDNLAHNDADERFSGLRRARRDEMPPPGFIRVSLSDIVNGTAP